ncbi:MAG: hypothetical protein K5846_06630 [Bacteroidales bacterium]|nr:hypothetical protein [Bacteroidales bacterium]
MANRSNIKIGDSNKFKAEVTQPGRFVSDIEWDRLKDLSKEKDYSNIFKDFALFFSSFATSTLIFVIQSITVKNTAVKILSLTLFVIALLFAVIFWNFYGCFKKKKDTNKVLLEMERLEKDLT